MLHVLPLCTHLSINLKAYTPCGALVRCTGKPWRTPPNTRIDIYIFNVSLDGRDERAGIGVRLGAAVVPVYTMHTPQLCVGLVVAGCVLALHVAYGQQVHNAALPLTVLYPPPHAEVSVAQQSFVIVAAPKLEGLTHLTATLSVGDAVAVFETRTIVDTAPGQAGPAGLIPWRPRRTSNVGAGFADEEIVRRYMERPTAVELAGNASWRNPPAPPALAASTATTVAVHFGAGSAGSTTVQLQLQSRDQRLRFVSPKVPVTFVDGSTNHDHADNARLASRATGAAVQCQGVYVYPFESAVLSGDVTHAYAELLRALHKSPYFTPDPESACALVPSVDTLCLHNLCRWHPHVTTALLASLQHWQGGRRHLVLHMGDHEVPANVARAAVAMSSVANYQRFASAIPDVDAVDDSSSRVNNTNKQAYQLRMGPSLRRPGVDVVLPLVFYRCGSPLYGHLQRFSPVCTAAGAVATSPWHRRHPNALPWSMSQVHLPHNFTVQAFARRPILLSFKGARYGVPPATAPCYPRERLRHLHNGADTVVATSCTWRSVSCLTGTVSQFGAANDEDCARDTLLADLHDFSQYVRDCVLG